MKNVRSLVLVIALLLCSCFLDLQKDLVAKHPGPIFFFAGSVHPVQRRISRGSVPLQHVITCYNYGFQSGKLSKSAWINMFKSIQPQKHNEKSRSGYHPSSLDSQQWQSGPGRSAPCAEDNRRWSAGSSWSEGSATSAYCQWDPTRSSCPGSWPAGVLEPALGKSRDCKHWKIQNSYVVVILL